MDYNSLKNCGFLPHLLKLFVAVLFIFGMAACDDDHDHWAPEPAAGLKLHIGEGNVVEFDTEAPGCYPPAYMAVLVMEDLPADEKIIYMGGVYSTANPEPDVTDCTLIYDYSDYEEIQDWDWEKGPLYWRCMYLFHPVPGTTYYLRGYVQTDKAEYYSNTIEVRSGYNAPETVNPGAYKIPVIFHLFPDADGYYPVKECMVKEQLDYANFVFGNRFNIPGQTETGVRFVPATHAPDGTPLETPGIVRETEAVEIDFLNVELDDKYVWDMEHALNVWAAPVKNVDSVEDEYSVLGGFAYLPFFDADELLEGCNKADQTDIATGIFLNSIAMTFANNMVTFAHEAGHFLGLDHVYTAGDDFCDDTPWYDREAYIMESGGDIYFNRKNPAGGTFWSDNIMDYEYGFMTGITPDQARRIRYTLQHAYFIPGPAGKEMPASRASAPTRRFRATPVR